MHKHHKLFLPFILFLIIGLTNNIDAQTRYVDVPQGFGTLNEAIDGDTTSSGDRVDPERTIYRLERGGYYLLNGSIENRFPLRIEAATGDGPRPILQPAVPEGGESSRPFRPRDDFHIKGLYVTNMDELGQILLRTIRVSADSAKVIVDDCHIDYSSQSAFRLDNKDMRIYIKNSIISNIGSMASPNNGRGIDDRGNDIDTLVMENNTWYNLTSRVLRDGGGKINYLEFNHNTLVNIGQMGVSPGEVIKAKITNNQFVNTAFFGYGSSSELIWSSIDILPVGEDLGVDQELLITNNNFYTHPDLINAQPDSVSASPVFDEVTDSLLTANGTAANNIEEAIDFTDAPDLPVDVVIANWDDSIDPKPEMDDGDGGTENQVPFDFAYPTSTDSYTHSTNGQPLGSLVWFDMVVNVEDFDGVIPTDFTLSNNYPNPFNPTTNIKYSLPEASDVRLVIYNSLGQEVKTLINANQQPGTYSVTWDGTSNFGNKVSSGVYIYRIFTGDFMSSKKMILMK